MNCGYCSNFLSNPERIVSPVLGSRKSQTCIYFLGKISQVTCGCFNGTLDNFEKAVIETHKGTKYAQEYLSWIKRVKNYIYGDVK
jgi:hypothetical protein